MKDEEIIAEVEETTTLPVVAYEYTPETAKALMASIPPVPDFDPSLGKRDPVNAQIIKDCKFLNKIDSTREKVRKQQKEPALNYGRVVDARSKELHEIFEPRKIEYGQARKQIDEFERVQEQKRIEAEQERLRVIDNEISKLRMIPSNFIGETSEKLTTIYNSIDIPDDLVFKERLTEAIETYKDTMGKLESMIATAKGAEETQKLRDKRDEQDRLRKEKADKEIEEEREAFRLEKEAFQKEKDEAQRAEKAEAEAKRIKIIEAEAKELEERQAEEAKKRATASQEQAKANYKETLEGMVKAEDKGGIQGILDAIINNEIRGLLYE